MVAEETVVEWHLHGLAVSLLLALPTHPLLRPLHSGTEQRWVWFVRVRVEPVVSYWDNSWQGALLAGRCNMYVVNTVWLNEWVQRPLGELLTVGWHAWVCEVGVMTCLGW